MGMEYYDEYTEENDVNRVCIYIEEYDYECCGVEDE